MRIFCALAHVVSFHPAHSGGWLSCDLHVKAKFVSSHHSNNVLVARTAGVQVDFGRIFRHRQKKKIIQIRELNSE